MPHKLIPTKSLEIQEGYNIIRDAGELKRNVKDVEAQMALAKDDPYAFPIRFVVDGKTKYTRNHATFLAAQNRGWEQVYAIELNHAPGSVEDLRDLITSNNGGHPVSRTKQGELYDEMANGKLKPDLENGAEVNAETDYVRPPMTDKQIAEAFGVSSEHVRQCRVLASTTPEIRELLESGDISANIVIIAQGWAKGDNAKQLRILKAAAKLARDEGAKTATKKHMDAIKSDFIKLKAAPVGDAVIGTEGKPSKKASASDNNAGNGSEAPDKGETAESASEGAGGDSEAENLFSQAESELLTDGSKKNEKLKKALATRFLDTDALEKLGITMSLTNEEADLLAEDVVAIVANARDVF